jgi:hypothetical protein
MPNKYAGTSGILCHVDPCDGPWAAPRDPSGGSPIVGSRQLGIGLRAERADEQR